MGLRTSATGARRQLTGMTIAILASAFCGAPAEAQKIYWTDLGSGKIQRANLNGSQVEDVVTGLAAPRGLALDLTANKLYWTDTVDSQNHSIGRANLDGSDQEILITASLAFPTNIALDLAGGQMIWASQSHRIRSAPIGSTTITDVVTGIGVPEVIAIDPSTGTMYWTDYIEKLIERADLDGSNLETVVGTGLVWPQGLALDIAGGFIYWTDITQWFIVGPGPGMIMRAELDGSNPVTLVSGDLDDPQGIALDISGGHMYWTDGATAKIQRANLDGTSVVDLVDTGLTRPWAIALDLRVPELVPTTSQWGLIVMVMTILSAATVVLRMRFSPRGSCKRAA